MVGVFLWNETIARQCIKLCVMQIVSIKTKTAQNKKEKSPYPYKIRIIA